MSSAAGGRAVGLPQMAPQPSKTRRVNRLRPFLERHRHGHAERLTVGRLRHGQQPGD